MRIKCGELIFNINFSENWNIPQNVEKFKVDDLEKSAIDEINYEIE